MLTAGDSSRAGTGNMCVRIADIEAVDKPRRFGDRRVLDTNDNAELPIVAASGQLPKLRVNMRISA